MSTDNDIVLQRARALIATSKQDTFYTPETKEDAEAWLNTQRGTMPTGIAFIIGMNYALRQIEKVLDEAELHDDEEG